MLSILSLLFSPLPLVLVLLPVLYYLYVHIYRDDEQWRAQYLARHGVPYEPQPGLLRSYFSGSNFIDHKLASIGRVGKVYGCTMFMRNTIMVAEPELIQTVMSKEFTNFTNKRPFLTSDPVFKNAITSTKDEVWKRQRAIITPTFATGKLRKMIPRVRMSLRTMLKNLDEILATEEGRAGFDLKKITNSFTMDTIAQVAFGLELDSLKDPNNELVKNGKALFSVDLTWRTAIKFLIFSSTPKLAEFLGLELNADVNRFFGDLIGKILLGKREAIRRNAANFRPTNFIELLIEAEVEYEKQMAKENEGGGSTTGKVIKSMSNDEIMAQSVLFFVAGFEATASIIAMVFHDLAMNERCQDKLYNEIETVLATLKADEDHDDDDRDPIDIVELEHLNKFKYLAAVVDETLRVHAPGLFAEREAAKDVTLATEDGRYKVNVFKGDIVHVPIPIVHLDADNFPEPNKYRPERFLEPTHHNYAYLPFGQGPRNCVAKSFARMEVKLTVLHLVHRYKFARCAATKDPLDMYHQNIILAPKAVPLRVERRV